MSLPDIPPDFWEKAGATKEFTHPLDDELLRRHLPREVFADRPVLDYGCGYGRLVQELTERGYREVTGVDVSRALIARGRREHPAARLLHAPRPPLPFPDGHFAAALLFAVLTSVPADTTQRQILAELGRSVAPGGVLYVSDVPLQDDERNLRRYERFVGRHGTWGVFGTDDGGTFRHHPPERLRSLLTEHGFSVIAERSGTVGTLDGSTVTRLQLIARRGAAPK